MKKKEMAFFFTHVADMQSVGISLQDAISSFSSADPKSLKKILKGLARGLSFAEALSSAKLPTYVCSTVKAGEKGGALEEALRNIAEYTEDELLFSQQVKKTLFMPVLNIVIIFLVAIFLATNTLPKLEGALSSFGNLPQLSKTVFHVARLIRDNLVTIIVSLVGGIGSLVWWFRTNPPILLSVPVIGTIIRYKFIVSLFNRLVLIHRANGNLQEALKIVEGTETGVFKKILRTGIKKVERGKQMSEIFNDPFFPRELKQMVSTASENGKIDATFERISQIYKKHLSSSSDKLGRILEPASILVVGMMVLVVMLSTLYPIITASDSLGGR